MISGRLLRRVAALVLVAGAVGVAANVLTAANTVPTTYAGRLARAIDANALKPPECAALNLTAIVAGGDGTGAAELILGTPAGETIRGNGGGDCIVGGGGDDTLRGSGGGGSTDVCIGGPGNDHFVQCGTTYQ